MHSRNVCTTSSLWACFPWARPEEFCIGCLPSPFLDIMAAFNILSVPILLLQWNKYAEARQVEVAAAEEAAARAAEEAAAKAEEQRQADLQRVSQLSYLFIRYKLYHH